MWTTSYILSQVFSACAYIIFPLTFLTRNKKNILLLNILNSVFYLLSYLFLAGYSGVIVNAISIVRGITFFIVGELYQKKEYYSLTFFVVATIALSIVFYRSWVDILPMIAGVSFTYAIWQKNVEVYRWIVVVGSVLWITYNVLIFSIVGMIGEAACLVVETIILIVYYVKQDTNKEENGDVSLEVQPSPQENTESNDNENF